MSMTFNNANISASTPIYFNNQRVREIYFNNNRVWWMEQKLDGGSWTPPGGIGSSNDGSYSSVIATYDLTGYDFLDLSIWNTAQVHAKFSWDPPLFVYSWSEVKVEFADGTGYVLQESDYNQSSGISPQEVWHKRTINMIGKTDAQKKKVKIIGHLSWHVDSRDYAHTEGYVQIKDVLARGGEDKVISPLDKGWQTANAADAEFIAFNKDGILFHQERNAFNTPPKHCGIQVDLSNYKLLEITMERSGYTDNILANSNFIAYYNEKKNDPDNGAVRLIYDGWTNLEGNGTFTYTADVSKVFGKKWLILSTTEQPVDTLWNITKVRLGC